MYYPFPATSHLSNEHLMVLKFLISQGIVSCGWVCDKSLWAGPWLAETRAVTRGRNRSTRMELLREFYY